jgi:hypothetical protein
MVDAENEDVAFGVEQSRDLVQPRSTPGEPLFNVVPAAALAESLAKIVRRIGNHEVGASIRQRRHELTTVTDMNAVDPGDL